ncbi:MAG: NAD(P)/FAD-dependent oxidoreductase, partial [Acidimicrobiales bacterium]
MSEEYRSRSLWLDNLPDSLVPRLGLPGDTQVDVAIVGAGYTGLWTAYYLLGLDPRLRVLILEKDIAGFGASGRNGGWCIGELAAGPARHERTVGNDAARRFLRELFDAVDEVGRVAAVEGIDCHYTKGGTLRLARNTGQLARQREEVELYQKRFGLTDDDVRLLGAEDTVAQLNASRVRGGVFWAHTAALHPARLVRGLAMAVEGRGATIAEKTTVTAIEQGRVTTDRGTVRAEVVVRALEGYTPTLVGHPRTLSPLYSLMVATEPLSDPMMEEIGLGRRQTFSDERHLVIYGQRTADNRIAFGGRGAPYGFGSRIDPRIESRSRVHERVIASLVDLLPTIEGVEFTHRWGGVLGVPRDW